MVRSMIAGVAGLKAHQSKMDVIGNNIANVNTWGFKGYSYNFKDSMYTNSLNSSGGSVLAGAAGGRNASQVGYGSQLSSISNVFESGAPSPSANPMDCMIDGTGFFLVGNMVNGAFTDVKSAGLNLSRVGIFRVDENGYLVDDQRSYVYGYAVEDGTGIPETPARAGSVSLTDVPVQLVISNNPTQASTIKIAGQTVELSGNITNVNMLDEAVQEWVKFVTNDKNSVQIGGVDVSKVKLDFNGSGRNLQSAHFTITAKEPGEGTYNDFVKPIQEAMGAQTDMTAITPVPDPPTPAMAEVKDSRVEGNNLAPSVAAVYSQQLSTIQIPVDPDTGSQYELKSYSISEDGTVVGVDNLSRVIPIGKVCVVSVQNPNGLEKTDGYYYSIGDNAGDVYHEPPGSSPAGSILGSYLEMANVDLANEFSNIITTQRGFQANSKIITVTDEMLQELVNMKR